MGSGAATCLGVALSNKQNGERVGERVWVRAEGRETASKVREVPGGGHGTVPGHAGWPDTPASRWKASERGRDVLPDF